ncbi:MAG: hypothetical protein ACYCS1_03085 [Gammaproteobacteria bacterium]
MKNLKRILMIGTLVAVGVGGTLSAKGFDYTYVGGGFVSYTPSGGSSGTGPYFDGSYNFNPHFNAVAGYQYLSYGQGVNGNDLDLGVGFHTALKTRQPIDLVAEALFLHSQFDVGCGLPGCGGASASANGFGLAGGVRWHPMVRKLEIDGLVGIDTYSGCTGCHSSYETVTGAVQYYFMPHLSGVASVSIGTNSYGDQFTVGVNYYFPRP